MKPCTWLPSIQTRRQRRPSGAKKRRASSKRDLSARPSAMTISSRYGIRLITLTMGASAGPSSSEIRHGITSAIRLMEA
jgi:hypothetical protein